jgi:hypothetical protein
MAEGREPYRIEVAQRTSAFQVFENDFSYFRVLPACRNPDGTKRNMSMKELNEAVQMWMNRAPANGPELFICPAHGESWPCPTCHHSKPHEHAGENCNFEGTKCKKCIPYKEPAQTPAPEEGRTSIQHLQDRVLELELEQGRADLMEMIRGLEDKTSRELSQAFAEVNRVLAERKQSADVARDVSNAQAHEILKIQDRIAEIEKNPLLVTYDHRPRSFVTSSPLSEGGTSSVSSAPSVEGKPKSRLKTDRTKKVK